MTPNNENTTSSCNEDKDGLPPLQANFVIERFTYYYPKKIAKELSYMNERITNDSSQMEHMVVKIQYATSTQGRNLIHETHDSTGIMLWPASHLICQYIAWNRNQQRAVNQDPNVTKYLLGEHVVELGCGCGIVSVMAGLTQAASFVVCTDMDKDALQITQHNIQLNHLHGVPEKDRRMDGDLPSSTTRIVPHELSWGDANGETLILSLLEERLGSKQFDTVMAADIIYPATCGSTLERLFQTVDHLLKPNNGDGDEREGIFLLSFVTRDGYRTPTKFIDAASKAGYKINGIDSSTFLPNSNTTKEGSVPFPPLMGAQLLVLTKHPEAAMWNHQLGSESCQIFPGIKNAAMRALEESSEEEWNPPYFEDDISIET